MQSLAREEIQRLVATALREDLGGGDITANLIPADAAGSAVIISREKAVVCGRPWVDEVYAQLDIDLRIQWLVEEGEVVEPNRQLLRLSGNARKILTGERTALNLLQTLSATATATHRLSGLIAHTGARLLDTRKTLPGLRIAQKYAVRTGGGMNHRMGLYDAFLIKENHIAACGTLTRAVETARSLGSDRTLEVEVETDAEFEEALAAMPDVIMLDNFSIDQMTKAATRIRQLRAQGSAAGRIKLEASGGIESDDVLRRVAETGVDYVSVGALTKHCRAIDLSMRFRLD